MNRLWPNGLRTRPGPTGDRGKRLLLSIAIVTGSALAVYFATGGGRHGPATTSASPSTVSAGTAIAAAPASANIPPPFETAPRVTTGVSGSSTGSTPVATTTPASQSDKARVAHQHRVEHRNVAFARIRSFFRRLF